MTSQFWRSDYERIENAGELGLGSGTTSVRQILVTGVFGKEVNREVPVLPWTKADLRRECRQMSQPLIVTNFPSAVCEPNTPHVRHNDVIGC
jgi:hypothetical protein